LLSAVAIREALETVRVRVMSEAALNDELPACEAVISELPAPTICTLLSTIVETAVLLLVYVTERPELAEAGLKSTAP